MRKNHLEPAPQGAASVFPVIVESGVSGLAPVPPSGRSNRSCLLTAPLQRPGPQPCSPVAGWRVACSLSAAFLARGHAPCDLEARGRGREGRVSEEEAP